MKFGQLIEWNMRSIFVKKSFIKCRGETIPRSFSKEIKLEHISGSVYLEHISGSVYLEYISGTVYLEYISGSVA